MTKRREILLVIATATLLTGACGGDPDATADTVVTTPAESTTATDDDLSETDSATPPTDSTTPPTDSTTTTPTTTSTTIEPITTEPADSGLPEWASGEMVTVDTDTGPLEIPVELAPFCESSRAFYVGAKALDFIGDGQVGTAEQLFAALAVLSPVTVETAPSEEFATEPTAAADQLAVIIGAFERVGYDAAGLRDLPDAQSVSDAAEGFTETRDSLQQFLVEACGADPETLDDQARETTRIASQAAGESAEPGEPGEPVEPSDGVPITNRASNIAVSVPAEWSDTDETLQDDRYLLAASSDLTGFFELTAPGVLVLRGEGGFRDGGFVGRVLEGQSDLEESGCTLVDERDYDDGLYAGKEQIFECGIDGLDVRLLGGTTADEALYAMVLLVNPVDEPGIRELIVTSFEVS